MNAFTDFTKGETIWARNNGVVFSFEFHEAAYSCKSGRILLRGKRHDNKKRVACLMLRCAKDPVDLLSAEERAWRRDQPDDCGGEG